MPCVPGGSGSEGIIAAADDDGTSPSLLFVVVALPLLLLSFGLLTVGDACNHCSKLDVLPPVVLKNIGLLVDDLLVVDDDGNGGFLALSEVGRSEEPVLPAGDDDRRMWC